MSAQGKWILAMKTPVGEKKLVLVFNVDGSILTGTITDDDVTTDLIPGTVEGQALKWGAKVRKPMPMTLEFTGTLDGDSLSGGAKSLFGTAQFTGQRA